MKSHLMAHRKRLFLLGQLWLLGGLLLLGLTSGAQAVVIAYEGFDYGLGPISGGKGATSFGFGSNNWQTVSAGGAEIQAIVSQPSGFTTGTVAQISHADSVGGNTVISRALAAPISTTKTSLLQTYGTDTLFYSGIIDQLSGNDFITLRLNTISNGERVGIGQQTSSNLWNAFGGNWGTRVAGFNHTTLATGVTTIAASVQFTDDLGTNAIVNLYVDFDGQMKTNYLVALQAGGSALTNFFNTYRAATTTTTGTFLTLDSLGIGVGARDTTTATSVYIDEFRLATSFGEAIGVIPEPSRGLLCLMITAAMLLRRKRPLNFSLSI